MVTEQIKQLEATKAKMAKLEKEIAARMNKELAALPGKYGFDSAAEFVEAVLSASGGKRGAKKAAKASKGSAPRRKRAVITAATHQEVKKLVEGGKTGAEIAKLLRISVPSVHNIKKALGLVKARK